MKWPSKKTRAEVLQDFESTLVKHNQQLSDWNLSRGVKDDFYWLGVLLDEILGDGTGYRAEHGTEAAVMKALEEVQNGR